MPVILLFVFVAVPIAEIAIFIEAGEKLGLWPTLGLVILTAVLGTALLRRQGLQALARVQQGLDRGEMPVGEVFTGLCLLVAGALLLTPGFLTDAVGFALFVPAVRRALSGAILRAISTRETVWVGAGGPGRGGSDRNGPGGGRDETVIDGEYTEIRSGPTEPRRRSTGEDKTGKLE